MKKVIVALIIGGITVISCRGHRANNPPNAPVVLGPDSAQVNESVTFRASATDPDGDSVAIRFDWGDGDISSWSSYVSSGQSVSMSHTYTTAGTYYVKVQAKDVNEATSDWSSAHKIVVYSGQIGWTKTYGGGDWDWGYSIQQTLDGGYIVAGETQSFGVGWTDVYLIKTDANGDVIWTKTYGGSGGDCGNSVQQTSDGGYIIVGGITYFDCDVYLIKTDANGDVEWTKTYGGSGEDCGNSVQQTSDGGYIIVGKTTSFGAGASDVYLIKTDANGNAEWTKTYGGGGEDCGNSVQQTSDGGYIIVGGTTSFGAGGGDVYLIKTDAYGNVAPKISIGVVQPGGVKSMLRSHPLHIKYEKLRR